MFNNSMQIKFLLNHIPTPIIIFDKHIEIISLNTEVVNLTNLKFDCTKHSIKKWLTDDLNFFMNDPAKEALSFEKVFQKDEKLFYFEVKCKKIWDTHLQLENMIVTLNDITQHKETEIELEKSRNDLHSVFQNMPIMMDAIDEDDNIVVWNKECERVTGYTKEEIMNNSNIWEKLYPNEGYREKILNQIRELDCNFRDIEYELVCKDGSAKTISWYNISKKFPIPGWHSWGFGIDVTNRKNTEEKLRKKTEELEKIFEAMPDLYFRIDGNGNVLDCKVGINSDFNINPKECIGKPFINIVHEDTALLFYKIRNEVLKNHTLVEKEFSRNENGQLKYYEVRVMPLTKDEMIIIVRDISERKLTEEALRDSELRYRNFFNICPDLIYLVDMNDYTIIDGNPAFLRKMKIEKKDINNVKINDLIDENSFDVFKQLGLRILKGEELIGIHSIGKDLEGNTFPAETNCVPIIKDVGKGKLLCCTRDITERNKIKEITKKAEENRKLLNEAVEYERLRTEFFANISHEFRTPINVILGAIQLMDMQLNEVKDLKCHEKAIKLNKSMKQNCYRLIRLVNNLIDITRIDSGFLQLNLKNCDIVKIVKDITLSVSEFVKLKDLMLEFDSDIDKKIIACDPDKIERILLNLLSNAIKFTKHGDKISVYIKNTEDAVIISVKDTGMGIQKENLKIIFERFRQVNKSLTREQEGSGIGLSLVKMLVEMHGGSIGVDSVYKKGSEFLIKLPVKLVPDAESKTLYKCIESNKVEKVSIEFSDIYF